MNRQRWTVAVIVSFGLHMLWFLLLFNWKDIWFRSGVPIQDETIAFDFIPEKAWPRTLVETPESSANPPERANFLSDRNSEAANPVHMPEPDRGLPFADGDIDMGSIRPVIQYHESSDPSDPVPEPSEEDLETDGVRVREKSPGRQSSNFSRDRLLGIEVPSQSKISVPSYKEIRSSVEKQGGVGFNTYAWEYAPYLLKLKDRLESNLFPPASFTRLGFGGSHLIRFRILRTGVLSNCEVLGHEGDQVLTQTSLNAIRLSDPFWELPDDFPEQYLEVTALFRYIGKESH